MIQINIPMWLRVSLYLAGAVALKVGKYLVAKHVFGAPEMNLCTDLATGALVLAAGHAVAFNRSGTPTAVPDVAPGSSAAPDALAGGDVVGPNYSPPPMAVDQQPAAKKATTSRARTKPRVDNSLESE